MRKYIFSKIKRRQMAVLVGDSCLLLLALTLSVFFKYYVQGSQVGWSPLQATFIHGLLIGGFLLYSYIMGLYVPEESSRIMVLSIKLVLVIICNLFTFTCMAYFIPALRPGKTLTLMFSGYGGLLVFGWHWLARTYFPVKAQKLLLIGKDKIIEEIIHILNDEQSQYYEIVDHWHANNNKGKDILSFVKNNPIDTIVYTVNSRILKELTHSLLKLKFMKINIHDASNFYQRLTGKLPIYHLSDFWMLFNSQKEIIFPRVSANLKRAFDIFFVTLCFLLAFPILLACALAIKLNSPGPVFFVQERLGLNGVPFNLIKLRTMVDKAEANGPQWCGDEDPRITKVGRVLRKLRLDELPQLINVLKNDISLVGPRPIREHFVNILEKEIPFYRLRLLAKPGITGWAQVHAGHANSVGAHGQMVQYDLFYITHQSLWLDLYVLLKTVRIMLFAKGR